MTRIALQVGTLAAALVAVAVSRYTGQEPNHTAGRHGLEGWIAPRITEEKQARKEIETLLEELHGAYRDGNQEAAAARMQFPVLMITDDWKGEVLARYWDRDTWIRATAPVFEHPAPELHGARHHDVFVISDALASVQDEQAVTMGKKKVTIKSGWILVKKDRGWLVQAAVEGGWANSAMVNPAAPPQVGPTPGPRPGTD